MLKSSHLARCVGKLFRVVGVLMFGLYGAGLCSQTLTDQCTSLDASVEQMVAKEVDCAEDVAFNYRLGTLAMDEGQYTVAESAFRRVVSLKPSYAGAWLDLASVYYKTRHYAAMSETLDYLESHFDLPPAIARVVSHYRAFAAESGNYQSDSYRDELQIEMEVGFSDNINNGSSNRFINLGGVELLLSDDSLPKSASFTSVTAFYSGQKKYKGVEYGGWLASRQIKYDGEAEFDNGWWVVGGMLKLRPNRRSTVQLNLYQLDLETKNSTDQRNVLTQIKYAYLPGGTNVISLWGGVRAVDSERSYYSSDIITYGAQWGVLFKNLYFYLSTSFEEDKPKNYRNGGVRESVETKVGFETARDLNRGTVWMSLRQEDDETPYSTALFGTEHRDLERLKIEGSYSWRLSSGIDLGITGGWSRARSPIGLFDSDGWNAGVKLGYLWQ